MQGIVGCLLLTCRDRLLLLFLTIAQQVCYNGVEYRYVLTEL